MDDLDDNLLADYDLSAWEVPPPAAGLADTVVRRAREPVPRAAKPRSLTPWIIGAGSLAALVAVLAIVMWGVERAPKDGSGVISATGPRTLDLGRSTAALDSGAQLRWTRRGASVAVSQSRGAASWRVSDEDKLVIDATVASIEATGASLRVEVEMNRSDVRAMGVGSAAAVVVSLVTVIVYEGHVKATSNGQTVNIQPGASMQFGHEPPVPTPTPPEQLNVGGTPEDQARIKALEAEVSRLKLELAARDKAKKDATPPAPSCDEVSCVLNNYSGTCCDKYKKKTATKTCDADAFTNKGDDYLSNGMDTAALAQFEKALACGEDLAISKKALLAACRSKNAAKAKTYLPDIPAAQQSSYSQICLRFGITLDTPTPPACDAAAAKQKGDDFLSNGMDTAALAKYEESLRCKYDATLVKTAYLAACRSKQQAKAKLYFAKLPTDASSNYIQLCLRFGIDPTASSSSVKDTGTVRLQSKPPAEVFLDGKALGTTPVTATATAGRHKVTYVVDANKYTFAITVKANEVTNLVKDLSVE